MATELAKQVGRAQERLEVEGLVLPRSLLRDLCVAGTSDSLIAAPGRRSVASWDAWLNEVRQWRMVARVRRADPVPLARAIALRALAEQGTVADRRRAQPGDLIADWMARQWKARRSLREAVGNEAWHESVHSGSSGGLDLVYGELRSPDDDDSPLPRPRLTGTEDGGLSRKWVRSNTGVIEERSAGRMPDNPGRLAPIEHAYRVLHPDLFLERVANSKLMQGFGAKEITSRLRVALDVWIDIVETEQSHRLPGGVPRRGIDVFRAVACDLLRDLAACCDPRFVSVRVSLRRWLPGSDNQSDGLGFELADVLGESVPRDRVPRALTAAGCTVLSDHVAPKRGRTTPGDLRPRRADALVRVLLGPNPVFVERPWSVGGRQQVVGLELVQRDAAPGVQEFELRQGTSLDMQDGVTVWRGPADGRGLARRVLDPVLGVMSVQRSRTEATDLLGGLS